MDIVTLAAARKGGGGGDVTRAYVDEHLALKADKSETKEYPIASATTGINPSITDSADGLIQDLTVYGESRTSKNLLDLSTITEGYAVSTGTGNLYSDVNSFATNYIDVHALPAIICHTGSSETNVWGAYYDQSLGFIRGFNHDKDLPSYIPEGAYYARITFLLADKTIAMVEVGETPTPYEPYFSGIHGIGEGGELEITTANSDNTASTTATVTTGIPLYAVGDVKDELDEKKGVVVKRCGETDLGSFAWGYQSETTRFYSSALSGVIKHVSDSAKANCISTIYKTITLDQLIYETPSQNMVIAVGLTGNISIRNTTYTDAAVFRSAMSGVMLVYELAEPYEIPLTSTELSALRNLRTYASTTNVTGTDDPTVDIGYLLDTDNGQAVADVQIAMHQLITGALEAEY